MAQHLRIQSRLVELARARSWVGERARAAGMSEQTVSQVGLAVSEACSNIVKHAYRGEPDHAIDLRLDIDSEKLVLTIHDSGDQFNLENYRPPDLDEPQEGGYGVFLIRSLMDDVRYERPTGGGSTLTLVKYHRARIS